MSSTIDGIVVSLKAERDRIDKAIAALAGLNGVVHSPGRLGRMAQYVQAVKRGARPGQGRGHANIAYDFLRTMSRPATTGEIVAELRKHGVRTSCKTDKALASSINATMSNFAQRGKKFERVAPNLWKSLPESDK